MIESFDINAYGKINLALDIVGLRPDGYHEVSMIMQSVELHDTLSFKAIDGETGIDIACNLSFVPCDERNIIAKAYNLLAKEYGIRQRISCTCTKNIPVCAGMAGGSTDAAATLRALNVMFELNLSQEELMKLGSRLGADVPFCLMGGTALSKGIGEVLTPIEAPSNYRILLVRPNIPVSTKEVYAAYDKLPRIIHPNISLILDRIEKGDLRGMCQVTGNVLEYVTAAEHHVINTIEKRMLDLGALGSMMTGSGPTVFGIFTDSSKAQNAYNEFMNSTFSSGTFLTSCTKKILP